MLSRGSQSRAVVLTRVSNAVIDRLYYILVHSAESIVLAEGQSPSLRSQKQDRISFRSIWAKMARMRTKNIRSILGIFVASVLKRKNRPGDK